MSHHDGDIRRGRDPPHRGVRHQGRVQEDRAVRRQRRRRPAHARALR